MDASERSISGNPHFELQDGSRIAIIGGGPAGSLFAYFFLDMIDHMGLDVTVEIYERKDFCRPGPAGCNQCGGIVSESLVQTLATEGINLPSDVVQRGIEAYDLHTDCGSIRIMTPVDEKRIAAVHRGGGPLKAKHHKSRSFDDFLLQLAIKRGAIVHREYVSSVAWPDGRPLVSTKSNSTKAFDLLVVAVGVNSVALKIFEDHGMKFSPPAVTRTAICEYELGEEDLSCRLGNSMHLFLMNLPRMKFAAIIPKGSSATMCILGKKIDRALVDSFMSSPEVFSTLGNHKEVEVCRCGPKMALTAAGQPFADRLVFIGDSGASRLYKDGIGAAYRTAKAAATTVAFKGFSEAHFKRYYKPTCDALVKDNRYGSIIFLVTTMIQKSRLFQRAVLRMVAREQASKAGTGPMSIVLWDTFTGSAPYREIFFRTLRPGFLAALTRWLLTVLVRPRYKEMQKQGAALSAQRSNI